MYIAMGLALLSFCEFLENLLIQTYLHSTVLYAPKDF